MKREKLSRAFPFFIDISSLRSWAW